MPVDPNAVATWANAVTVARVLVAPILFLIIPETNEGSWLAIALWFALSASDGIDGWLARRHGTTRSGAFLDPLADKILVLGAMFTLVERGMFPLVPVAIIAVREIGISVYRVFIGAKGVSMPASRLAKLKTLSQQLAVGAALLPITATASWTWTLMLWVSVVLAVWSGGQYLWRAHRAEEQVAHSAL